MKTFIKGYFNSEDVKLIQQLKHIVQVKPLPLPIDTYYKII